MNKDLRTYFCITQPALFAITCVCLSFYFRSIGWTIAPLVMLFEALIMVSMSVIGLILEKKLKVKNEKELLL